MPPHPLRGRSHGYSLAEVLIALVIASMIIVAVLAIFNRIQRSAQAVTEKLQETDVPSEVMQLIVEDLDRLHQQENIRVTVENKTDHRLAISRLTLAEVYYDESQEEQEFRTVIWQADYDLLSERLILYRKHSGLDFEDKLLDSKREDDESLYPFIPVCGGLTLFKVEIPQDHDQFIDTWEKEELPHGLRISLSLETPTVSSTGELLFDDEDVVVRTIALDRTRKIAYKSTQSTDDEETDTTTVRPSGR